MVRLAAALLLVISLVAPACSPEAATSRAERGSATTEATPEPTRITADIVVAPDVVVAPTPVPDGPRPLIVMSILGESGVLDTLDFPALAGVVAEVDRLNAAGGVLGRPIELRRFDTTSRASLAERLSLRLEDNPPDLVIASCDTQQAMPVLEKATELGIITISPCADDVRYLTGGLGSKNFTMGAPAEQSGALAAAQALELYGPTAIVLRDVTSPEAIAFCDGFERAFRELGGSVTYRDEFSYDTLEPVQDRLAERAEAASSIALCSHVPGEEDGAPALIGIVRSLGFSAPLIGGNTLDQPGWFARVPNLGELTFISWSSSFGNDPDDRINTLVQQVQQNGETAGAAASTILGAESIEAWARAVENAGDASPDLVAAALGSFNNEPFSTGEISFVGGARMDVGRTYRVLQVVNGELSVIALESTPD